jgi:hypothetical protein
MQRTAASPLLPRTASHPDWRERLRAALYRWWLSACAQAERKTRKVPYY